PAGTLRWKHTAAGPGDDIVLDMALTPAGDIVLDGYMLGATSVTFNNSEAGFATLTGAATATSYVVKYNAAGALQWGKVAGSLDLASSNDVDFSFTGSSLLLRVDSANNIYLGGSFGG